MLAANGATDAPRVRSKEHLQELQRVMASFALHRPPVKRRGRRKSPETMAEEFARSLAGRTFGGHLRGHVPAEVLRNCRQMARAK
jgi:hypothetical protein